MNPELCTFCNLFSGIQGMMHQLRMDHVKKEHIVNGGSVQSSNDLKDKLKTENCVDMKQDNLSEKQLMNSTPKIFIKDEESTDNCHEHETEYNDYNNYSDDATYKVVRDKHMDFIEDIYEKVIGDQATMIENKIVHKFSDSEDAIYPLEPLISIEPVHAEIHSDLNSGAPINGIKGENGNHNLNVVETNIDQRAENTDSAFQNEQKGNIVVTDKTLNISVIKSVEDEYTSKLPMNIHLSKTNINEQTREDENILWQLSKEEKKIDHKNYKLNVRDGEERKLELKEIEENWICNHCASKFLEKKLLNAHKRKYHQEGGIMDKDGFWKCNICIKKCSSKRQLQDHRREVHVKDGKSKKSLKSTKDGEKDDDGFWKCNYCTMRFPFRKQLIDHVSENHKSECPDRYTCTVCGRGFRKEESFKYHRKVHEEKTFQCLECSKVYNTKLSLYIHVKNMHRPVESFTCETCGQRLKHKNKLIQHINVIHKKIRRFKCINCSSCFGSKNVFQSHCKFKHKVENKEAAEKMLEVLSLRDVPAD